MPTLYELADEAERVIALLEDTDGEIADADLAAMLDALNVAVEKKVEGVCHMIRHFESGASVVKAEVDRLRKLFASRERSAQRLEDYLMQCMDKLGMRKCETPLFTVSVVNNSVPVIRWTGRPEDLPAKFQRLIPAESVLDSKAALEAWKKGELPEGFSVEQGKHLRGIS